ncbi:MAG: tetratricopeptide repeat protein [Acidobacteriota bacterium]|nr:tetratricopeptide repeat protein [Acidobacteriota bacterium]
MKKNNVIFGIVGLVLGLIIGFAVTNSINRNAYSQMATQNAQNAAFSGNQPQVSNQVVRDQPRSGGAAMPQIQQTLDRAKNEPDNFAAQMEAGEMYYRIQRFEEAADYFEKAIQIRPDDYDALVKAGNARFDAGAIKMESGGNGTEDFIKAEKIYEAALTKKPNDPDVRTDLGLTYLYRQPKDIERALKEFRASLVADPNHEITLQSMARALKEKGDTAAFQETLVKLEKVNPDNRTLGQLRNQ